MSDTALDTRKHRKDYSEEEIELGLSVLAWCAGDYRRAERMILEQHGCRIPGSTIRGWSLNQHQQRYEDLRRRLAPRIQAAMAQESEDLARTYARAEGKAAELFFEKAEDLDARDAARVVQQFAVARGISTEKSLLLRGQPTSIEMRMDIDDLFARLGATSDEDIVDAEVVEDGAAPTAIAIGAESRDKRTPA